MFSASVRLVPRLALLGTALLFGAPAHSQVLSCDEYEAASDENEAERLRLLDQLKGNQAITACWALVINAVEANAASTAPSDAEGNEDPAPLVYPACAGKLPVKSTEVLKTRQASAKATEEETRESLKDLIVEIERLKNEYETGCE